MRYADSSQQIIGFDIVPERVSAINKGHTYIEHISSESLIVALEKGLKASTDFSRINECDAIIP